MLKYRRKIIILIICFICLLIVGDFIVVNLLSKKVSNIMNDIYVYDAKDFFDRSELLSNNIYQIDWNTNSTNFIIDEQKIYRDDIQDINASLTANISGVIFSKKIIINIKIPSRYVVSPYSIDSLKNIVDLSLIYLDDYSIAKNEDKRLFENKILEGINLSEKVNLYEASILCREIVESGKTYLKTISNYSDSKKQLISLIYSAKAELLIDIDMYTNASKEALQREIASAENILAGNTKKPYSNYKEFIDLNLEDSMQFAIRHYSSIDDYFMSDGGLAPALEYFKKQNLTKKIQKSQFIYPVDGYFADREDEITRGKTLVCGSAIEDRVITLDFELPDFSNYNHAYLYVTNSKSDKARLIINSNMDNIFSLLGRNRKTMVDITNIVSSSYVQSAKRLRLDIDVSEQAQQAIEIYGIEGNNDITTFPYIEIYTNEIDTTKVEIEYEDLINKFKEFDIKWKTELNEENKKELTDNMQTLKQLFNKGDRGYLLCSQMILINNYLSEFEENILVQKASENNLFFDEINIEQIKEVMFNEYKDVTNEIKETADKYNSLQLHSIYQSLCNNDLESLGKLYSVWSNSGTLDFTVPDNTSFAYMTIALANEDNIASNIGYAWIDQITITSLLGDKIDLPDSGFENEESKWKLTSPHDIESKIVENCAYNGRKSLYLQNNSIESKGYWKSEMFELSEGEYSLEFYAKIYQNLTKGIKINIHFVSKDNEEIGRKSITYNTKSSLTLKHPYEKGYQACAIMYMLTDELEYALRAREYMMLSLDENLQGMDAIRVTNQRPNGDDKYVAVRQARNGNTLATAYSLIKKSKVISEDWELYNDYKEKINYFTFILTDLKDRTENKKEEYVNNSANWQLDMAVGTAMMGIAFYDILDSPGRIISNGIYIVEGQMEFIVNPDGSWPEAVRYFGSSLERLSLFAKAIKHVYKIDWFNDENTINIIKMYQCFLQLQTPKLYMSNSISTPVIGDSEQSHGEEFALFGMYWDEVFINNPEFSFLMFETWNRAGKSIPELYKESNGTNMLQICFINPVFSVEDISQYKYKLVNNHYLNDYGLFIIRNNEYNPNTMLTFIANEQPLGHNHYDQLSINMYYENTPFIVDPGVGDYFSKINNTYISTGSHATVQFHDGKNWVNSQPTSFDLKSSFINDLSVLSAATKAGSQDIQKRNVIYIKKYSTLIIYDNISTDNNTRWNLPVLLEQEPIINNSNSVELIGFNKKKCQLIFMKKIDKIYFESIAGRGELPIREGSSTPIIDIIRAEKNPDTDGYLTLLNFGNRKIEYTLMENKDLVEEYQIKIEDDIYNLYINKKEGTIEILDSVNSMNGK